MSSGLPLAVSSSCPLVLTRANTCLSGGCPVAMSGRAVQSMSSGSEVFTLAPRSLRCGVPAISLRPVTAPLARLLACHSASDKRRELPPDRLSVVIGGAAHDRECSLLSIDAASSGRDQQLKQIRSALEENGPPDAVVMP